MNNLKISNFFSVTTGVFFLALITINSLIGLVMFNNGTKLVVAYAMEDIVKEYKEAIAHNKNVKLPSTDIAATYRDFQHLPEDLRNTISSPLKRSGFYEFDSEQHEYIVYFSLMEKNESLYLVHRIVDDNISPELEGYALDLAQPIIFALLFSVLIAILLILILIAYTIKPIRKLEHWSTHLSLKNINKPLPNFRYRELNAVAKPLQRSVEKIQTMLEKEQFLLRATSHELRTPIAIISSNTELLTLLSEKLSMPDEAKEPLDRISRAAINMNELTRTVLWLARDENRAPNESEIDLDDLLSSIIANNQYLLSGKEVRLVVKCQGIRFSANESLVNMILSNLIRNAMQYTYQGDIQITLEDNQLMIINANKLAKEVDKTGADYGFGLGLALVEKITTKINWYYRNEEISGGRRVTILLPKVLT